jgi:trehalose 6-phosphate phosphatase
MPHLFSNEGMAQLSATLRRRPLLAFDFDGTLAPIVPRPDDARVSPGIAGRLQRLARMLPLAVVSGRAVADVRARLGFEPRYLLGNHGAEGLRWPGQEHQYEALAGLRQCLHERQDELLAAGIMVEDKGGSLALHYRLARDREQAIALLESLLHPPRPEWRVFGGKMVVNVAPAAAPDKADAVMALAAHCGAECAFFAGDDVNDEPVFVSAPAHWLTVRIGREDQSSRAMYFLDSYSEMGLLLQRMLDLLPAPAGQPSAQG